MNIPLNIKHYIEDNVTLIDNHKYDEFFTVAPVGTITLFIDLGINIQDFLKSMTYIPQGMFQKCDNLTSLVIPSNIRDIDPYAFCNCNSLTNITIPDSVRSIGRGAFVGCTSLTSITIPDSVTSIGGSAFGGCVNLRSIQYNNTLTKWTLVRTMKDTFYNCPVDYIQCTDGRALI